MLWLLSRVSTPVTSKSLVSREFSRIFLNFTSRSRSQGIQFLKRVKQKSFHFSFLEKNKTLFISRKKSESISAFTLFLKKKVWNCAWNFAFCHENSTFWSFITLNCNIWNVDCLFEKVYIGTTSCLKVDNELAKLDFHFL